MKIRTIKLALLAALCLAFAAAPAAAKLVRLPGGRAVSVTPRHPIAASQPQRTAPAGAHLDYAGGPVLHTNSTVAIYWHPSHSFSSAQLPSGVDRFLGDVAHDSGTFGNDYSVITQYFDFAGAVGYQSGFAGRADDVGHPYPAGCVFVPPDDACVTDSDIRSEINAEIGAAQVPANAANRIYFVVLPQKVAVCFPLPAGCSDDPAGGYCGIHDMSGGILYAVVLDDPAHCGPPSSPDGDPSIDAAVDTVGHEHIESITDPSPSNPAWYDFGNQNEVADECGTDYGPALGGSGSTQFNESMNSHPYELQEEWSNDGNACLQYYPGLAPSFANGGAVAGQPMSFLAALQRNPDASYAWSFGDGGTGGGDAPSHAYGAPGAYAATLTVATTGGRSASISRAVGVGVPPPSAAFTRSPRYARARRSVDFDAGASRAPFASITAYRWSFGDGATATGPAPRHSFRRNRDYLVTLTIAASTGATAATTQRVAVGDPAASFSASGSRRARQRLTFSAHASDPDGRIVRYRWDFGDGHHASGRKATHAFAHGGRHTVTLTVTDSDRTQTVVTHKLRLGRAVRRAAAAGFETALAGLRL